MTNSHWLCQTNKWTNVPWFLSLRIFSLFTAIEFRVPVCGPGCQIVSKCVPHSGTRLRRRQRPEISWYNTRGQSVTDLSSLWRPDNSLRDSQIEADTKWPALDYVMISCLLICLYILNYKRLCLCVHHFWFKCPQPVQWHWIKHLNAPSQCSDSDINI